MPDVCASVELPAPPEDVFALLSDPVNDSFWCDAVRRTELTEGAPRQVGARYRFVEGFSERRGREGEIEITELEPPRRMVTIATTADRRYVITYELEPSGTGTRLTQRSEAHLNQAPGPVGWVFAPMMKAQMWRQLRALRKLVRARDR